MYIVGEHIVFWSIRPDEFTSILSSPPSLRLLMIYIFFRQIIHELMSLKKVAVTSTTGVASWGRATTLHHWSGVKDGRMTTDELKQTFASDEQFHDARQRILSTETLIIDDDGMHSQLMFEKVELLCRIVKNPHLYIGGLQVNIKGYSRKKLQWGRNSTTKIVIIFQ